MKKAKKPKTFKCAFSHCMCNGGIVTEDEAVKVNSRYWHKDCYEIRSLMDEVEELYLSYVSSVVPIRFLKRIINDIVFGKKLMNEKVPKQQSDLAAARYLNFCMHYAVNHNHRISAPPGLYYLIANERIKKAYEDEQNSQKEKQAREEERAEKVEIGVPVSLATPKPKSNAGFGDILKGGN